MHREYPKYRTSKKGLVLKNPNDHISGADIPKYVDFSIRSDWYFASDLLIKSFPNQERKLLAVFKNMTRADARTKMFEEHGTRWVEYSKEEWADFTSCKGKSS